MNAVITENTNTTFVAEGCGDLPATRFRYADGVPAIETCWELSPEDLAEVNRTGKVYLRIFGTEHPPVYVDVKSDLEE